MVASSPNKAVGRGAVTLTPRFRKTRRWQPRARHVAPSCRYQPRPVGGAGLGLAALRLVRPSAHAASAERRFRSANFLISPLVASRAFSDSGGVHGRSVSVPLGKRLLSFSFSLPLSFLGSVPLLGLFLLVLLLSLLLQLLKFLRLELLFLRRRVTQVFGIQRNLLEQAVAWHFSPFHGRFRRPSAWMKPTGVLAACALAWGFRCPRN